MPWDGSVQLTAELFYNKEYAEVDNDDDMLVVMKWNVEVHCSGDDKDWFSNLGAKPRPSSFKSNAGMYVTCKTEFEKGLDI